MSKNFVHTDFIEIIGGSCKSNSVRGIRSSCLELVRQSIPRRRLIVHKLDHVAAHLVGRHRIEHRAVTNQSADSHRATHLVSAERVEVDAKICLLYTSDAADE